MTIKQTKEIILDLEYQKQIVEKEIESAKELLNNLSLNLQVQKELRPPSQEIPSILVTLVKG